MMMMIIIILILKALGWLAGGQHVRLPASSRLSLKKM